MRGHGRGWRRYDRDLRRGGGRGRGGGGLGWTSRCVAPQDDPVIDAYAYGDDDQREVLREIEVRWVVQARMGAERLLQDRVDYAHASGEHREDAAEQRGPHIELAAQRLAVGRPR